VKKGLIVDDATIMRLRLREIIEEEFSVAGEAGDGDEALRLYEELKPDFVTLDISMPRTNGMEALKILMQRHPTAKVVIVSAVGQKKMVLDALGLGAKDFVIKPFERERVMKAIRGLFPAEG